MYYEGNMDKQKQSIVYTLIYAIDAADSLGDTESVLDVLRGYGMAEVVCVSIVNKPLEEITIADAPSIGNCAPGKITRQ